jgi:signal transduction histidine kinase
MQERMKALGGDVQVESTPGKGTHIVAHCKRLGISTGDTMAAPDNEDVKNSVLDTFKSAERI